jgi:hypothetical protein
LKLHPDERGCQLAALKRIAMTARALFGEGQHRRFVLLAALSRPRQTSDAED